MGKINVLWCWITFPYIHEFLPPDRTDVTVVGRAPIPEEELVKLAADVDFIVVRRFHQITRNVILAAKRLKLIQKVGVSTGNIDVAAAKEAGVPVAVMPSAIDRAVAEHAIMFMLALTKKLIRAHKSVVDGEYEKLRLSPRLTSEFVTGGNWMRLSVDHVYQKTLGLIGVGDIGSLVAERAKSFEMNILYHKRRRLSEEEEQRLGIQYTTLEDLLKRADYVSLHVPHTEETDKMLGRKEFSIMKPTAYLINVSRGGVVDEKALCEALKNRVIAGAGLDVFEEEPTPKDNPLLKLDNIILTPHIGGTTHRYEIQRICENILRVANGEKPVNEIP